jgi:hypothetical protein
VGELGEPQICGAKKLFSTFLNGIFLSVSLVFSVGGYCYKGFPVLIVSAGVVVCSRILWLRF